MPNNNLKMDLPRCSWVNLQNPLYVKYHDCEWGKPVHDDHRLFEMLLLESSRLVMGNGAKQTRCFQTGICGI